MNNFGFVKVAAAVAGVRVADPTYNSTQILALLKQAVQKKVRAVSFAEMSLTGYTCGDLFLQPALLQGAEEALARLLAQTKTWDIIYMVGLPVRVGSALFNAAVVCYKGKIYGVVPKTYLPNYHEFYEGRWFDSALDCSFEQVSLCGQLVPFGTDLLFQTDAFKFGIEICEDLWAVIPPSSTAVLQGAEIIFNLSASNALVDKNEYVHRLVGQQSARGLCGYVYASCGAGESTTDVVFDGNALIFENGKELASSIRFHKDPQFITTEIDVQRLQHERRINTSFRKLAALQTTQLYQTIYIAQPNVGLSRLEREIDPMPFVPQRDRLQTRCREIFNIQVTGLATRLLAAKSKTAVLGISGGLDSTLALLVAVKTADRLKWSRKQVIGITMPGFGTTDRTYQNALTLMKQLGICVKEISIKKACEQHFKDIGHSVAHDVTYENAQARERTQILMDVANQMGGLVVGTADLSEAALGWSTYNGDHMSMYGVNSGVPKTLVKSLVAWIGQHETTDKRIQRVLADIVDTPISPELLPADAKGRIAQKTEDLVGPYILHDFFLYQFVRCGFEKEKILWLAVQAFKGQFNAAEIKKWLEVFFKRFFVQQFKRSCMPDGPKVGSVSLSPRGDWRMPSDASVQAFI